MKLQSFIINKNFTTETQRRRVFFATAFVFLFGILSPVYSQKIAVITSEKNLNTEKIVAQFTEKLNTLDSDLVSNALQSTTYENPFNLSTDEAKNLGNAIGCDFFIVLKSENLRRTSFEKPLYFESYATVFLVSTRTGKLVFWTLKSFQGKTPSVADKALFDSIDNLSQEIKNKITSVSLNESKEIAPTNIEEIPEEHSPEAKNFRSPLPYKRFVPAYKSIANLYSIAATVDALVDLDEKGKVTRIEIARWAGYDLDDSVIETIKKMNWRPATRNGKTLPIRILLRYNFKKIEKEV